MQKRWRLSIVLTLFFTGFLFQGCATLNGTVPFKYVPSLPSREPINLRLGMEKLVDIRPEDDRSATESIADVDEKVTAKLLEDFRSSQIFATIGFPAQREKDDLIMKGEIKRFYWKMTPSPIIFIPLVNIFIYFGVPVYNIEGVANLHVQLVSSKTGQIIAEYDKNSTKMESYTIYSFKAGEAGAELAEAFRDVSKQIKEAIFSDENRGHLSALH